MVMLMPRKTHILMNPDFTHNILFLLHVREHNKDGNVPLVNHGYYWILL